MRRFLKAAGFAAVAVIAVTTSPAMTFALPDSDGQTQKVEASFIDAMTRCRVAVETAAPFDAEGYKARPVPESQRRENTVEISQWLVPDTELVAQYERVKDDRGRFWTSCILRLADPSRPMSAERQAILARAFMIEERTLVSRKTHEKRTMDNVYPLVSTGFAPVQPNANGCSVIVALFYDPDGSSFQMLSGEQVRRPCIGDD